MFNSSNFRTLSEEIQWLEQKRLQINIENTGATLLEAQKLLIRHHHLTNEVDNRAARSRVLILVSYHFTKSERQPECVVHSFYVRTTGLEAHGFARHLNK